MHIEAPSWMDRLLAAGLRANINSSKLYSTFIGFDLPDWPKLGHSGDALLYRKLSDDSLNVNEWWLLDNKNNHVKVNSFEQLHAAYVEAASESDQDDRWVSLFAPLTDVQDPAIDQHAENAKLFFDKL